jgi:AcrR family transcriptional regulator
MARDPEGTQARILDAAFEEFCEKGLAGARVDAIADRAGVNKRMLYHYFGNKEELFTELLRRKAGQTSEVRAKAPEAFPDLLAHHQAQQCADGRWTRLLMFEALAYGAEEIANREQREAGWRAAIAGIEAAQEAGALPRELDAAQLQLSLVALVAFPVAFPQYTRMITGRTPDDPRFLRERQRFLRELGRLLEATAAR